ncbi:MAG: peptidase and chymotrypsin/Hap [Firmicutes bacterium]|nr:peptidase and chymotrypsin/Hap [Bacillota bacterium]
MGFFYMSSDDFDRDDHISRYDYSSEPVQPAQSVQPAQPVQPVQPADLNGSVDSAGPHSTTGSIKPSHTVQLSARSLAIFASATIILSSTLGFGGGYVASLYFPATSSLASVTTSATNASGLATSVTTADSTSAQVIAQPLSTSLRAGSLSVAQIANLASPSVVEITTEVLVTGQRTRQYVAEGAGSGVILTADGLIVTNNHVIDGAQTISVRLSDGQTYPATLVGTDSQTDVALVKIDATGLVPATLGNSDQMAVGDLTVAIGNPLGELGGTVTDGIISALDREITLDDQPMNLLQTNAAINPGNSGGGLFDAAGNLIGIVVAKSSGTDVEGLGFAIPINDVKTVITDLQRYGYVQGRINFGMTLLDIDSAQLAAMYRVQATGVYVLKVDQTGSAASAGFASGDRIVSIDGTAIVASTDVQSILKAHSVSDKLTVVIERDGQQNTLEMTLQASTPTV